MSVRLNNCRIPIQGHFRKGECYWYLILLEVIAIPNVWVVDWRSMLGLEFFFMMLSSTASLHRFYYDLVCFRFILRTICKKYHFFLKLNAVYLF